MGYEPMTSAIPVQRSKQLSYQANWELVICKFVVTGWHKFWELVWEIF